MNRIDVAIVRFLPFVLYILIGVCTTLIICGKDIGEFYLIHGNSDHELYNLIVARAMEKQLKKDNIYADKRD